MSLLVTGSIGIDTVLTPDERADEVLGGTAVYFAFSASLYVPVRLVAVVGDDFPPAYRDVLATREIDLAGLEVRRGSRTFRWTGRYKPNMNERDTLEVQLNVLEEAPPGVPDEFKDSTYIFLANTHPVQQQALLGQIDAPKLVVCDTMDLWIANERESLLKTLGMVNGVIVNDAEARQLTGRMDLVEAGRDMLELGPQFVIIKKGEHGATLFTENGSVDVPAFPTEKVRDPTGAGDSFAGGFLGYLAQEGNADEDTLRQGLAHGTVAASFAIEDFSLGRVRSLTRSDIDRRVAQFVEILRD